MGTAAIPVVPEVGKSGVGTYSTKPVVPSMYADSTTGLDRASTPENWQFIPTTSEDMPVSLLLL